MPSYTRLRWRPMGSAAPSSYIHFKGAEALCNEQEEPLMSSPKEPSNVTLLPVAEAAVPALDRSALEAARRSPRPTKLRPGDNAWTQGLIGLLNDALATELVCILRYKRHHYTAHGLASPAIADEFMVHALEETGHADRLARRIVQLGGEPDFSPDTLTRRSHAAYNEERELEAMIHANLVAECVAVESYSQLVALVGDKDPTSRRLLEDILADEQKHADELQGWLVQ
jgi:bacterioferritin